MMNGPRIHNEERAQTGEKVLTVNRFAAVIALIVSLLPALVIYTQASNQFAILNHTVSMLQEALDEQDAERGVYRRDIDARLRVVENQRISDRQDLSNALALWTRIDARLERLEERLINGTSPPR